LTEHCPSESNFAVLAKSFTRSRADENPLEDGEYFVALFLEYGQGITNTKWVARSDTPDRSTHARNYHKQFPRQIGAETYTMAVPTMRCTHCDLFG